MIGTVGRLIDCPPEHSLDLCKGFILIYDPSLHISNKAAPRSALFACCELNSYRTHDPFNIKSVLDTPDSRLRHMYPLNREKARVWWMGIFAMRHLWMTRCRRLRSSHLKRGGIRDCYVPSDLGLAPSTNAPPSSPCVGKGMRRGRSQLLREAASDIQVIHRIAVLALKLFNKFTATTAVIRSDGMKHRQSCQT